MFGALVIDKPSGWTSHDVVAKMRRIAGTKRIGHLGTLDPMATGVLPLLLGPATRLARFFDDEKKVYEGAIRFGFATSTYDREGEALGEPVAFTVDVSALSSLINDRFLGEIEQVPPAVSAKKVDGVPAYKLARQNKAVDLKPVKVNIEEFELLGAEGDRALVKIVCSPGTYIRSIAHDLGQAFGVGAHLDSLRRLASGGFRAEQAITIEEAAVLGEAGTLEDRVIPAASLLPEIPVEVVDEVTAGKIREGRDFHASPFVTSANRKWLKAVSRSGRLIAMGEQKLHHIYHPALVFPLE